MPAPRPFRPPASPVPDLFGTLLLEYLDGARPPAHLRRADGRLAILDLSRYFAGFAFFPEMEQQLLLAARGDVLDLGAGAGRVSLYLQELAQSAVNDPRAGGQPAAVASVVAVDASAGACDCLRRRGVEQAHCLPWAALPAADAAVHGFDCVALLGNGLGMAGTPDGLLTLLGVLRRLLRRGGTALVTAGTSPGGMSTMRLRVESGQRFGEWFDWLEVSFQALCSAVAAAGLTVLRGPLEGPEGEYGAILSLLEIPGVVEVPRCTLS